MRRMYLYRNPMAVCSLPNITYPARILPFWRIAFIYRDQVMGRFIYERQAVFLCLGVCGRFYSLRVVAVLIVFGTPLARPLIWTLRTPMAKKKRLQFLQ